MGDLNKTYGNTRDMQRIFKPSAVQKLLGRTVRLSTLPPLPHYPAGSIIEAYNFDEKPSVYNGERLYKLVERTAIIYAPPEMDFHGAKIVSAASKIESYEKEKEGEYSDTVKVSYLKTNAPEELNDRAVKYMASLGYPIKAKVKLSIEDCKIAIMATYYANFAEASSEAKKLKRDKLYGILKNDEKLIIRGLSPNNELTEPFTDFLTINPAKLDSKKSEWIINGIAMVEYKI